MYVLYLATLIAIFDEKMENTEAESDATFRSKTHFIVGIFLFLGHGGPI